MIDVCQTATPIRTILFGCLLHYLYFNLIIIHIYILIIVSIVIVILITILIIIVILILDMSIIIGVVKWGASTASS